MNFDAAMSYYKALSDVLESQINLACHASDSFHPKAQGLADWYFSHLPSKLDGPEVIAKAYCAPERLYLVLAKAKRESVVCYVFDSPHDEGDDESYAASDEMGLAFSIREFCNGCLATSCLEGEGGGKLSFLLSFVTLSDGVPVDKKRRFRHLAALVASDNPGLFHSSGLALAAKGDLLDRLCSYMTASKGFLEGRNAIAMAKRLSKRLEGFVADTLFKTKEEARLVFLSMLSGVDSAVISSDGDFLTDSLIRAAASCFDGDCSFVGRIARIGKKDGVSAQNAAQPQVVGQRPCLFIHSSSIREAEPFSRLLDLPFKETLWVNFERPLGKMELIWLRERAERVVIPAEIKMFLFEMRRQFESYRRNAFGSSYEIPDFLWPSLSRLFRMSAALFAKREVDYCDLFFLDSAVLASERLGKKRWIERLVADTIERKAFMPLRITPCVPHEGLSLTLESLNADASAQDGVCITGLSDEPLDVKITGFKVLFKRQDRTYSIEEASAILDSNERRIRNLMRRYATLLKRGACYTHRYDDAILKALDTRLSENSIEKGKLAKMAVV